MIIFTKHSIADAWQGSGYTTDSEYTRVLNMPRILNIPGFLICQGSKYVSDLEFANVLNIPGFWIYQSYTAFWIYQNNSWTCLNVHEYTGICVNMPISAWMTVLYLPIVIPCLPQRAITHFNAYTKLEITVWRNMKLFSWIEKL